MWPDKSAAVVGRWNWKMTMFEFQSAVREIYAFFRQKIPNDDTIGLWFAKVKHIPSGRPFEEIVASITNLDNLPKNMANAFSNGWSAWMNANRDSIHQQMEAQKTKCDYCRNTGFLFSQSGQYTYVSRCPKCRNWIVDVNESLPAYTVEELRGMGFVLMK